MLPEPSTHAGKGEHKSPHLRRGRCSPALSMSDAQSHVHLQSSLLHGQKKTNMDLPPFLTLNV